MTIERDLEIMSISEMSNAVNVRIKRIITDLNDTIKILHCIFDEANHPQIETINFLSEALGLLYAQCKPDLDEMTTELTNER